MANPIRTVDGNAILSPSLDGFKLSYQNYSTSSSGYTEDGTYHPCYSGRRRTISLKYNNISITAANAILNAFKPYEVSVCYLDPEDGDPSDSLYITKTFIVDKTRKADIYSMALQLMKSVSIELVEKGLS